MCGWVCECIFVGVYVLCVCVCVCVHVCVQYAAVVLVSRLSICSICFPQVVCLFKIHSPTAQQIPPQVSIRPQARWATGSGPRGPAGHVHAGGAGGGGGRRPGRRHPRGPGQHLRLAVPRARGAAHRGGRAGPHPRKEEGGGSAAAKEPVEGWTPRGRERASAGTHPGGGG